MLMWTTYRKLWDMLGGRGRLAVIGLFLLMLAAALIEALAVASVLPLVAGLTGDAGSQQLGGRMGALAGAGRITPLVAVFCVAVVAGILLRVLSDYTSTAFSWAQNVRWSRRLLRVHLNSDYEAFLGRHSAEIGYGLLGRVQEVVSGSLLPGLRLIVNVLVVLCICGVLLRTLPPMVLLGVAGIAILYCGIFLGLRKRLSSLGKEREIISATRFRLVSEIFGGIKEIKLHGLEAAYDARTRVPFDRHAALQSQRHLLSILPRYLFEAIGFIALCLVVLLLGASDTGVGSVLPTLGMVGFAAFRLLPALQQVYQNAVPLPIGLPALDTLHAELMAGQDGVAAEPVPLELQREIALSDAHYSYPGAPRPSVDGVDLRIAARTTVALVGTSGAGKSTLADLTIGLLAPTRGSLAIDGVVLDAAARRAWRANCAYVPQQVFLLDDSIAANIAFGLPEHQRDMQRVESAARAAALHDFVAGSLPDGYATRIGERGVRLSGGQRQRIGIARALYRDAAYLVLDEATNALDPGTEAEVMLALDRLSGTRTVLVIAHRLSTVERCDRVLLVEDGRIIADGRYQDLMRDSAAFRRFANADAAAGTLRLVVP